MPNRLNNWRYKDIVIVLKEHGFKLNHTRGSHYYFYGVIDNISRHVCVPYHASIPLKPRTMKGIILQSGISQNIWLKEK